MWMQQASKDVRRMEEELLSGRKEREQLDLSFITCQEELNASQQKVKVQADHEFSLLV